MPGQCEQLQPLSPKQHATLRVIADLIATSGHPPSMQEIADSTGVSKVTAWEHVQALARKGYVALGPAKARRSIRVLCVAESGTHQYPPHVRTALHIAAMLAELPYSPDPNKFRLLMLKTPGQLATVACCIAEARKYFSVREGEPSAADGASE